MTSMRSYLRSPLPKEFHLQRLSLPPDKYSGCVATSEKHSAIQCERDEGNKHGRNFEQCEREGPISSEWRVFVPGKAGE